MTDHQVNQLEQLVAENRLLKQRVDQMQRLTALGELVSTTTHEFNNVLMTILNYAKMGMRHRDDATRDKALDKIYTAAERANKITNSVLGMARNRSNQFETTDLAKLIEQTMVLMERELNKYRVSVDLQIEDVPSIQAIGNQLQQVLLNLLINARQAMPDGGQLIVRLYPEGESVHLAVRDFGTGIPADKLKKIFDPYFSTKEGPDESGKGGTGLGLAACKNIVDAHGGKIRVESTVGKGTCFTLKLPAAQARQAPLPAGNHLPSAATPMNAKAAG